MTSEKEWELYFLWHSLRSDGRVNALMLTLLRKGVITGDELMDGMREIAGERLLNDLTDRL